LCTRKRGKRSLGKRKKPKGRRKGKRSAIIARTERGFTKVGIFWTNGGKLICLSDFGDV